MSNQFFDTQNGTVLVNSAWLAALMAANPAALSGTSLSLSGNAAVAGALAVAGPLTESVATGLTASTTHTLVGATPLPAMINNVTVCANASDAVALPAAPAAMVGAMIIVFNSGAAAAKVWPQAAATIDGGSAGVAVTLTNALRCAYICIAVNTWISAQLGVASA